MKLILLILFFSNLIFASYIGGGNIKGGISSINADTTAAQVITGGTGISVSTSSGTTTITNTNLPFAISSVTSSTNLACNTIYFVNASAGVNLTFPAPVSGCEIRVKDSGFNANTNNFTFVRYASESIENVSASYVYSASGGEITWMSDGTNWYKF